MNQISRTQLKQRPTRFTGKYWSGRPCRGLACWLVHASLEVRPRLPLPLAFLHGPETRPMTRRPSEVGTEASEARKQAGRPCRQWEVHVQRACGEQEQVTRASIATALLVKGCGGGQETEVG